MKTCYILAENKKTDWKIVISKNFDIVQMHAAEELKNFLYQITGATFPIVFDDIQYGEKEIIVGNSIHLEQSKVNIDFDSLGNEGFIIETLDGNILIAGNKSRGTLYGVYTFLEDYLGCRWFYRGVNKIPRRKNLYISEIKDKQIPVLEYRDPYFRGSMDGDWHARNKSNSHFAELGDIHGYKVEYAGFVHTFDSLVPVSKYFDTNPEYFSEVDGERISERTQLCLTNDDVFKIVYEEVRSWLIENPKASIVSVSQNDWINPCECKDCKAMDEYEESHSGTMIYFVNKVAEAIEEEFPHVAIDTLAYQYTRKPPKYIVPRDNVIVRLCSIECCFSHPLETCRVQASFTERDWVRSHFSDDLIGWSKICNRLHIWDYVTNFANYLQPFPNFHVLQDNIKFFIKHNVTGIFEEGNNSAGESGEFDQMRQYVLAKLLWNPDYDVDIAINEFLIAYYGMAAPQMKKYFDLIHEEVNKPDIHMGIYNPQTSPYLNDGMIDKANKIFDKAELMAENDEILKRVQIARLSITYVVISRMPLDTEGRAEKIDKLIEDVKEAGIIEIRESFPLEGSEEILRKGIVSLHNS